jgi:acetolactate synthase-1/2/3 large subunit
VGTNASPAEGLKPAGETPEVDAGTWERPEGPSNADAVARALEREGIPFVFGVQGGAAMPVFDALHRSDAVRLVDTVHEQGAAFAADGYARVTGEPGVLLATSGPGALNTLTGLAGAYMDSVPVVALTGQVPRSLIGTDGFQEADPVGMSRSVTKWSRQVRDADGLEAALTQALERSKSGRPRPTHVDLPKDLVARAPVPQRQLKRSHDGAATRPPIQPERDRIHEAAKVLLQAEQPMILAGHGVELSSAENSLRLLAETLGAPVATTLLGLTAFPASHELSLGMAGMHGTGPANTALGECDALLVVGARLDDRVTGDLSGFAPEAEILHVDVDPTELGKNLEPRVGIAADARHALASLQDEIEGSEPARPVWRSRASELWSQHPLEPETVSEDHVAPGRVVRELGRQAEDDAIVVSGVGQHQMWTALFFGFEPTNTWLTSGGLGAMGYAVPAAIGAKLAARDRQVVVVDGDGSFHMTANELSVARRLGLDVTVFVLDNGSLGMVRQWQDLFHDGRRAAVDLTHVPSAARLASVYGCRGRRIEDGDELEAQVRRALEPADRPTVVEVPIPADQDVYPMVPPGTANHEFLEGEQA